MTRSAETPPCGCQRCRAGRLVATATKSIDTAAEQLKLAPSGVLVVLYTEETGAVLASNMTRPGVLRLLEALAEEEAKAQDAADAAKPETVH